MSWFAGLFELLGLWFVGKKNKNGFIFNIVGGIIWIIFAISDIKVRGGLLLVCIPAFFINLFNFIKWRKEEKKEKFKKGKSYWRIKK